MLRRRSSPAHTIDCVVGARWVSWCLAVRPPSIVENATFVAPVTGAPFESVMVMNTALVAAFCGIDLHARFQVVGLWAFAIFTSQAVGVPPGPEMSPETMT